MTGADVLAPWAELAADRGCPLCAPRPAISERAYYVCTLSVSSLYLARNQAYRGTCALVYDPAHVTRPSELPSGEWQRFCADIQVAESAITRALRPDHVNLEILGNTVPHLHAGIIPRYVTDPRWGRPIWTTSRQEMPHAPLADDACEGLALEIRVHIAVTV